MTGELEILKEMMRSSKVQLKSKDTDIQRLNIKIRRLEKTNEIREQMINQVANQLKAGKEVDLNKLSGNGGNGPVQRDVKSPKPMKRDNSLSY